MTRLLALYQLFLRRTVTVGRLILFAGFGVMGLGVAYAMNRGIDQADLNEAVTFFVYLFGLSLMVPVISLVLASSSLGELVEDETLVYLWHRPVPRWMLAVAAWMATATVVLPMAVLSLAAIAALGTKGDGDVVTATAVGAALGSLAYSGVFVLLGLLFRKALIWGLIYLVVWELFVSKAGEGAARLSIGTYPSSVISHMTDIELPLANRSLTAGVIVPFAIALVGIGIASWRLDHIDVA